MLMSKYKGIFLESMVGAGGALTALAGSFIIGLAFGIPGLILMLNENKKPKSQRNMALLVIGFILMALGVAFGLGFNAEGLVQGIQNQL
jgi:hypothetical protein